MSSGARSVLFWGFTGAAQGEESRFRSHQAILTILIAVQCFKKAEKLITRIHVTCIGGELKVWVIKPSTL
jgi:hypothetical protein